MVVFSNTRLWWEETNMAVVSKMTCEIGLIWRHMETLYCCCHFKQLRFVDFFRTCKLQEDRTNSHAVCTISSWQWHQYAFYWMFCYNSCINLILQNAHRRDVPAPRNLKGEIGSLFDPCVNAMEQQPCW